jgi:CTP synthase
MRMYGAREISERHRHRYEFNREYEKLLVSYGLRISGNSPDRNFVEIIELEDHPWFLGCQFHPEFKSKPLRPHPLFAGFIQAGLNRKQGIAGDKERLLAPDARTRAVEEFSADGDRQPAES